MTLFQRFLQSTAAGLGGSLRAIQGGWKKSWQQMFARGDDMGSGGHQGASAIFSTPEVQSAWVSACCRLIHGQITPLDLEWYATKGDRQTELDDPELRRFWSAPAATVNGSLSRGEFEQLTLDYINLHGQAYWILLGEWWNPSAKEKPQIILAKPERMTPIRSYDLLLGWRFIDGAGHAFTLLPEQVIRPRLHNGHDDAYGLSALEAAFMAASGDHAAGLYQRNVAQANGDQGVYVIAKGGSAISDEQRAQITAMLRQKRELARRGDFRAAFLTGDVTVEDPKVKSVDAAFINGRNFSRDEIATAFGVPCSMLQIAASYSVGSASDRYRLVEGTCIPLGRILTRAYAQVEKLRSGRELHAEHDWDDCTVLMEARNERFKQAADLWKCGVPWMVLNNTFQLGLGDFPTANEAWLPMNLESKGVCTLPAQKARASARRDAGGTEVKALLQERGKILDGLVAALEKQATVAKETPAPAPTPPEADPSTPDPKRAALWKSHMAARKPSEKLFKNKFTKCLMAARSEVLASLDNTDKALYGIRQRGVLDLMFNLHDFIAQLWSNVEAAHHHTIDEATGQFLLEVGMKDDPWKMPPAEVQAFLTSRRNLMTDTAHEVFDDIRTELQAGLDKGESTAELATRVKAAFNTLSDERATTVAVTEVGAAYGVTRHAGMQGLDIEYKEWLTAQDGDRVRRTHRKMEGVTIPLEDDFIVPREDGGEDPMQHPCDPKGSAGNCINCRCVEIPVMEKPED